MSSLSPLRSFPRWSRILLMVVSVVKFGCSSGGASNNAGADGNTTDTGGSGGDALGGSAGSTGGHAGEGASGGAGGHNDNGGSVASGGAAGQAGGVGGHANAGGAGAGSNGNAGTGTGGATAGSGGISPADAGTSDAAGGAGRGVDAGVPDAGSLIDPKGVFVASGYNSVRESSKDGITWQNPATAPGPFEDIALGIAFGDGVVIVVGHAGVFRSVDAKTWDQTKALESGSEYTSLAAVTYDHGLFVALNSDTAWRSSDDGKTWTKTTGTGDSTHWRMAGGGGHFVAVGDQNGSIGTRKVSEDGQTWHDYTNAVGFRLNSVDYGIGRFVAVGQGGKAITSIDGKTWTPMPDSGTGDYPGVAFGDGKFVACGNGACIASTDGKTWGTPGSSNVPDGPHAFGNRIWVGGRGTNYVTSSDGLTWIKGGAGADGLVAFKFGSLSAQ